MSLSVSDVAKRLRESEKVDVVVALTHMRQPNDIKLAESVSGIDLILGGHDHFYAVTRHGDCTLVKSGTDFREFSFVTVSQNKSKSLCQHIFCFHPLPTAFYHSRQIMIQMNVGAAGKPTSVDVERIEVTSAYAEEPSIATAVADMEEVIRKKYDKVSKNTRPLQQPFSYEPIRFLQYFPQVVGVTDVAWDVRAPEVRTKESAVGNFTAGILRARYGAELGFIVGGTLRSDMVYPAGPLTAHDILSIFPFDDPCVVLKISGKTVLAALENGVSKYPAHDGRFPQISGFRFCFDPNLPPYQRVTEVC